MSKLVWQWLVLPLCAVLVIWMLHAIDREFQEVKTAKYTECQMRMRAARSLTDSIAVHTTVARMSLGDTCGKVLAGGAK